MLAHEISELYTVWNMGLKEELQNADPQKLSLAALNVVDRTLPVIGGKSEVTPDKGETAIAFSRFDETFPSLHFVAKVAQARLAVQETDIDTRSFICGMSVADLILQELIDQSEQREILE
jgi:hypothetical protein